VAVSNSADNVVVAETKIANKAITGTKQSTKKATSNVASNGAKQKPPRLDTFVAEDGTVTYRPASERIAENSIEAAAEGGATGFRYMKEAELLAIQNSGMLRGGNPGKTYFTKDLYKSGAHAQLRLSLPTTPEFRVEFEILNSPTLLLNGLKVLPDFGMPGKGAEFMTTDPVIVRLINWQPLR
jgi:hypothetical protein